MILWENLVLYNALRIRICRDSAFEFMQRIILISGFGGSGKTTCARLLRDKLEDVAIFGADDLFRMKPFEVRTEEGRAKIGRVKLKNSLAVLTTFIEEKCQNIIVDGLVWSQHDLDAVVEAAKKYHCDVMIFWLETSKRIRHSRAIARGRDDADAQEFLDLIEENVVDSTPLKLASGKPFTIQSDNKTPEEIVGEILKSLSIVQKL